MFELTVQIRDGLGNPTGKVRTVTTDSPEELEGFFARYNYTEAKKNNKRKKKSTNNLKNKLLKEVEKLRGLKENWGGGNEGPINLLILDKFEQYLISIVDLLKFKPKIMPLTHSDLEHKSCGVRLFIQNFKNNKELEVDFVHTDYVNIQFFSPAHNVSTSECLPISKLSKTRDMINDINN